MASKLYVREVESIKNQYIDFMHEYYDVYVHEDHPVILPYKEWISLQMLERYGIPMFTTEPTVQSPGSYFEFDTVAEMVAFKLTWSGS